MANLSKLLNSRIADNATEIICDAAKASLLRNKAMLSGDDSGLRNTWEEICVQVRGEKSLYWDAYECAMRSAVLGVLVFFDRSVIDNLWLHTDSGEELRYDLEEALAEGGSESDEYVMPDIPADQDEIARDILSHHLIPLADAYSNPQIEAYLYPGSDDYYDPSDDAEDEVTGETSANQRSEEVRELEYYQDDNTDSRYYTCINRHYIFQIRSDDPAPKWECINLDYTLWDAIHQRIYRNFRVNQLQRDQLPPGLPPPPERIPPEAVNPPPPPPPEPVRVEEFPVVADYLKDCAGRGTAALHLVLYEDRYESANGDGEFHYPEAVFFDLESAKSYNNDNTGWMKYHIRPGVIWLDRQTIGCEVPRRIFDHFSDREVLELLEKAISQESA